MIKVALLTLVMLPLALACGSTSRPPVVYVSPDFDAHDLQGLAAFALHGTLDYRPALMDFVREYGDSVKHGADNLGSLPEF